MRTSKIAALGLTLAFLTFLTLPAAVLAGGRAEAGKKVVDTKKLGNCAACHVVPGMEFPGDVGPNLIEAMKNYSEKDREMLRERVWDERKFMPDTIMPPFGANKILTSQQIDDVVDYLLSLNDKKILKGGEHDGAGR